MSRISRDAWAMSLALATAPRATCLRRSVGCVLLDVDGFILSTGHNGVAKGLPHCNSVTGHTYWDATDGVKGVPTPSYGNACPGAHAESGTNLDGCHAIHAEQNALLRCPDVRRIHTCYVTASPCMTCTKLLLNTACKRIVFYEPYPHSEAATMWRHAGRQWTHYGELSHEPVS